MREFALVSFVALMFCSHAHNSSNHQQGCLGGMGGVHSPPEHLAEPA